MNKKYSIGLFVGLLMLVYVLVILYQISYNQAERKREEERQLASEDALETEGKAYKEHGFVIMDNHGFVVVYYPDMSTIYEYTTIKTTDLPEEVFEKVSNGFYVEDEEAVYGFLENYSS